MAGEGRERLLRAVTRLQACVRGFLVRRRFGSLRAEFEALVRELEGELGGLRWAGRLLPRPVFLPQVPAPGERVGVQEAAPRKQASLEIPREKLDSPEAEQDSSRGDPAAQQPSKEELSSGGDAVSPPKPGADGHTEKGGRAPEESQEWQNNSSMSPVLEKGSPEACLEIPLEDRKELPRTRAGLESYRNHLKMELLWLQQAIVSRKNFLMLKQKLGSPDL
ncbi:IQ domain-containing protein C [Apus apus]|uniref:IQ domain-containing protein C n=1 Tax=Apus apus TaxID=8895 RepID=UPI0021F83BD8|nr:IQ domain-containing protein C [Apus apus]